MKPASSNGMGVDCPIDLFGPAEREVNEITALINRSSRPAAKGPLAGELRRVVARLLACQAYDVGNTNCRMCRELSELRDKTASLVERAAGLVR